MYLGEARKRQVAADSESRNDRSCFLPPPQPNRKKAFNSLVQSCYKDYFRREEEGKAILLEAKRETHEDREEAFKET